MANTASVVVDVKAKADLSALKETRAELADLLESGRLTSEQFKALTAAYGDFSKKSSLPKVIDDLRGVTEETEKAGKGMDLFKVNTSKAIGEAQVLVRELATGSFHARTLGSLMSAMGTAVTAAGIGLILVFEAVKSIIDEQQKLNEEYAKGNELLAKQAVNWDRIAASIRTEADLAGLTKSLTSEIGKLDEQIGDLTRKADAVSGLRRGLVELFSSMGPTGIPMKMLLTPGVDAELKQAQEKRETDRRLAIAEIEKGQQAQLDAIRTSDEEAAAIEYLTTVQKTLFENLKNLDPASKTFEADQKSIKDSIVATTSALEHVHVETLLTKIQSLKTQQENLDQSSKDFVKNFDELQDKITATQKEIDAATASDKVYEAQLKKTREEMDRLVKKGEEHFDQIQKQIQADEDLAKGAISTTANQHALADEIDDLTKKQLELNREIPEQERLWQQLEERLKNLHTSYSNVSSAVNALTEDLRKARAEVNRQYEKGNTGLQAALDLNKEIAAEAAVNNAQGNEELKISSQVDQKKEQIRQKYEAINKAAGTQVVSEAEIAKEMDIGGEALRHKLEVIAGTGKEQSTLNVEMKEYETILQNIRQQQQVTGAQSFIGVDQKDMILLRQYRAEIATVINAMQQQQQKKATLTDPAEIAKANQELQKFSTQYQLLAAKIVTTTHQFQAGLQSWANSFGSTGQQLANTLQQTVGAALQSFNQWIVTGKFNMQQLLQQIALLGLQLVEQLIIQRVVAMINARLAETQAVASSKIIAAAWASAATAVTIATEGEAAYAAPGAVAIGLAGVQGALGIGSLHEGGPVSARRMHSGGLAHDEVPIIAQEGEIMINRNDAARHHDLLLAINAGMLHQGGFVFGGRYHEGSDYEGSDRETLHFSNLNQLPEHWATRSGGLREMFGQREAQFLQSMWSGFGFSGPPGSGWALQGPTMIPTSIGSSGFPMAVSLGPTSDIPLTGTHIHTPPKQTSHSGGLIRRMHGGGGVGGGGGGGVHIYAFTDLKALTRHMGSKDGQKIIFDTVKGRRIDLGIS
jgi:predicted  nucleic acid-binding Zn-ribbon protein